MPPMATRPPAPAEVSARALWLTAARTMTAPETTTWRGLAGELDPTAGPMRASVAPDVIGPSLAACAGADPYGGGEDVDRDRGGHRRHHRQRAGAHAGVRARRRRWWRRCAWRAPEGDGRDAEPGAAAGDAPWCGWPRSPRPAPRRSSSTAESSPIVALTRAAVGGLGPTRRDGGDADADDERLGVGRLGLTVQRVAAGGHADRASPGTRWRRVRSAHSSQWSSWPRRSSTRSPHRRRRRPWRWRGTGSRCRR